MSIYPPNTTTPKPGSGNYLWNWLGSPLKKFAAALSPYMGGGESYKKYVALIKQDGLGNIEQLILENTLGQNLTFVQDGLGVYKFISPVSIFDKSKTFCTASFTPDVSIVYAQIGPLCGDETIAYLYTYDSSGSLVDINTGCYDVMVEIRVYP